MASVTFPRLWLNPADDLSAGVGFRLAPGYSSQQQTPGEVRQYGSRLRAVSTGVRAQQTPVTVRCDSRAQVAFLEEYQGFAVCARDPRGRKFYAIYTDLVVTEQPSPTAPVNATFTLNQVTRTEAV